MSNFIMVCRHLPRLFDYLWLAEDGMQMQGYNGSQLWDTAFAVQAVLSTGLASEYSQCLKQAHSFIDRSQVSALSYMNGAGTVQEAQSCQGVLSNFPTLRLHLGTI